MERRLFLRASRASIAARAIDGISVARRSMDPWTPDDKLPDSVSWFCGTDE